LHGLSLIARQQLPTIPVTSIRESDNDWKNCSCSDACTRRRRGNGQDGAVRTAISSPPSQQGAQVRLNVAMNFFVSGSADLNERGLRAHEQARRTKYQVGARECAVLQDTIASGCRMEAMNVNLNRHQNQQPEGFTVSGNMTFRITLN
jgi:hypothetical protein